jgi:hypothetical protein
MAKSMRIRQLTISGDISSFQTKHILTLPLLSKIVFYENKGLDIITIIYKKGVKRKE